MITTEEANVQTPGLFELINEFLKNIGEPLYDQSSQDRIKEAINHGSINFYIAKSQGIPVGIVSLSVGFSTYNARPFGVLDDFYVVPRMRKKGIARALMNHLISEAKKKGCSSVLLGCSQDDIPMYNHLGLRKIGDMMAMDI